MKIIIDISQDVYEHAKNHSEDSNDEWTVMRAIEKGIPFSKGSGMTHEIKILEDYADAIAEGRKNFEVRLNDRGYNAGDKVQFEVINKNGGVCSRHLLSKKVYEITYVHSGLGVKKGYVVFGIKEQNK